MILNKNNNSFQFPLLNFKNGILISNNLDCSYKNLESDLICSFNNLYVCFFFEEGSQ